MRIAFGVLGPGLPLPIAGFGAIAANPSTQIIERWRISCPRSSHLRSRRFQFGSPADAFLHLDRNLLSSNVSASARRLRKGMALHYEVDLWPSSIYGVLRACVSQRFLRRFI